MIIVIDGPAGSGKSTTARAVANRLNIEYLDSGALYRAVTSWYLKSDRSLDEFIQRLDPDRIYFCYENEMFRVWLDDKEITGRLRSVEVSNLVSKVAARREVRDFVNNLMHRAVEERTFIAEGRDLGTAVFPNAALKFFMTADVETRARRRYEERIDQGEDVDFEQIRKDIERRDRKDAERSEDPLKKAEDAIPIDTSEKTFEQQVDKICSYISRHVNWRQLNVRKDFIFHFFHEQTLTLNPAYKV